MVKDLETRYNNEKVTFWVYLIVRSQILPVEEQLEAMNDGKSH